ncbi:unnamed protein product, partial [Discosporangium mesarthrocarpum]
GLGRGADPTPAYVVAMAVCLEAGRQSEGLAVMGMAREDGVVGGEELYRMALRCCAGAGGQAAAVEAERVVREMEALGMSCHAEGYTNLVQAYGGAGRWEDALALVPTYSMGGGGPGFTLDSRFFCAVIDACGKGDAWVQVVALVKAMRRGVVPEEGLGKKGVEHCSGNGGSGAGGAGVAGSAGSASAGEGWTRGRVLGPRPDKAVYRAACRACGVCGEWAAVVGLLELMRADGVGRDPGVYAALIRAFAEAGEWERAVDTVCNQMSADSVEPDLMSFNQALRACQVAAVMGHQCSPAPYSTPRSRSTSEEGSAGVGWRLGEAAVKLLTEVQRRGLEPDVVSYDTAARTCISAGRPALALSLLGKAFEGSRVACGRSLLSSRKAQERLGVLQIVALSRLGRWEEVLKALDAMKERHGDALDLGVYATACATCAAAGQWSLVRVLISEVDSQGRSPKAEVLASMHSSLISALGR